MVVVIAVFLIAVVWSLSYLSQAGDDAARAATDGASTASLVASIRQLRPAGALQTADSDPGPQLQARLDDAMKSAEINPESLDRISPQPARHLEQSDLDEMPVQILFHNVTLRQILNFNATLEHTADWLCVGEVHLSHPQGASPDSWNADIIVSYLAHTASATRLSASAN